MTARRALTIGRLAAQAGVNLETIRYYERVGVMPEPDRTPGGHRHYTAEHRQRLAFIRRARELGFSLDDIRALIALDRPGGGTCAEVEQIAAANLANVRAKISDLLRLEAVLDDAVRRCAGGTSPSCPVIEVLGSVQIES
ncbi:MAG: helix-turn-helix domain-containing protein [Pseudomonadota bacterium]